MRAALRMTFCGLLITIFLMVLSGLAIAGTDVPQINRGSPPGAPGYDTANTLQNETALIQNKPNDPNNIVVATNDDTDGDGQVGPGLGICYSTNGGTTWLHSHIGMPGNMTFDPSIAADTSGNLYATCINDIAPNWNPPVAVYIHKSANKGANWLQNVKVRYYGPGSTRYLDKSWVTVDTHTTSSYTNNIYVVWQEDDLTNIPVSYIYFAKLDTGLNVSTPIQISESGRPTPYDNAPVPAVAPNGDIYIAWLDSDVTIPQGQVPGKIRLRKSTNGGSSFDGPGAPGSSATVASFTTVPKYPLGVGAGPYHQMSFPSIACDPTNNNNVYIVYAADPDGAVGPDDGNVYFTRSNNGGATWSTPLIVNDDMTTHGQFQPWIDVKPNGYIDVVWVDGRMGSTVPDTTLDIYMATSTDGGQSFQANQRVSDNSFSVSLTPSGNVWIGEYPGLDVDSSTAYISWTGVQSGDPDIWFDTMPNPTNTHTGVATTVVVNTSLTATFANVANAGNTTATFVGLPVHAAPSGLAFIAGGSYYGYFDLSTTAAYSGPIDIEFKYDPVKVGPDEANLKILHWTGTSWEDCTTYVDTAGNVITGQVTSLSLFALALPAVTIDIISPTAYGVYPAGEIGFEFQAESRVSEVKSCTGLLETTSGSISVQSGETHYLGSGLYTLTVTAEDNAGNIATKEIIFVVYDPTAGFVTGGGWIIPDVAIGEKATFGFVSKYKKGSTTPSGNLEFQYSYEDMNLKSTEMYWLVISDNSAIFQGKGTINGEGLYTYRVDATDGDKTAGKPDHFKITIWQGEDTESEPIHKYQGDLTGGSIIVHKK